MACRTCLMTKKTKKTMTLDYIIGIDPGVNTGFAVWNGTEFVEITSTNIITATEKVKTLADNFNVMVYYEDARLRHWFGKSGREKLMGAGSVRRDSQIWETVCNLLNIPFVAVAPKDNMTKLNAKQFEMYTGWKGRTNEHGRDAAMLVFQRPMKTPYIYDDERFT